MSDYLKRKTVIAFLENMAASRYLIQCFENKAKFPAENVKEVKIGKWIPIVSYYHGRPDGRYWCSECRRVVNKVETYCPDCGVRMNNDI